MLMFYLRYRRGWLKVVLLLAMIPLLLAAGAYAVLYRISGYTFLQQQTAAALAGTQRKANFDADVGRTLFPRPTIVLRHFSLTEADGQTPVLRAKEMRVGLAWRSLLGQPEVEKLVLQDVGALAVRGDNGQWNFSDFLDKPAGNIAVNRVQIANGNLMIQAFGRQIELKNMDYRQSRDDGAHFPYSLRATATHPAWQKLELSAHGQAVWDKGMFTLPDLLVQFDGMENNESFSGSLSGKVRFPNRVFHAEQGKLIFRSNRFASHTDLNIGRMFQQNDHLQIYDVNSVFTGNDEQRRYNGTLTVKQAQLAQGHLLVPQLAADLAAQASGSERLHVDITGAAGWQPEQGFAMPDFKLSTRQEKTGGVPRFVSEWTGGLSLGGMENWQIQAQGSFDRHPAMFELKRDGDNIDGQVELAKLNLGNYLDNFSRHADHPYPAWLKDRLKTNILITINALNVPGLEIFNIRTVLKADEAQAQFSPLIADLYSGHAEGSLSISNSRPTQYTLKQKAESVQIRPLMQDLFRNSSLSGKGKADLNFTTSGSNRRELTENLSGSLNINVENGFWHGISIRELMKAATAEDAAEDGTLALGDDDTKRSTPFDTFELKAKIQNGVSKHRTDGRFSAPAVRMMGKGETNLYSGLMSEDLSIVSNNGRDTLPLRLSGSMDNPSISLNYNKITSGLNTPKEKQQAVTGALKKQWEWIKEQSRKTKQESASEAATPKPW
ncbi:AsmA family protein [Conchiformibius steedae DSM 2580]|uniref:AsmA family protein n=1 Tax=Conchiformibius steedae DSM 2580 TaxID=1121352 RepID=A0AAE9HVF0_9NEIS|nr:AsmA family protein [Conchiformibius steedae]QMT34337.1 AsmA family protein [Conchiformibius steedae]URD67112.1 AsmA family protein [Conchiformibius steedae DSM 2580]